MLVQENNLKPQINKLPTVPTSPTFRQPILVNKTMIIKTWRRFQHHNVNCFYKHTQSPLKHSVALYFKICTDNYYTERHSAVFWKTVRSINNKERNVYIVVVKLIFVICLLLRLIVSFCLTSFCWGTKILRFSVCCRKNMTVLLLYWL